MRNFKSDTENLRDTRIAYTFLISLAVVCLALGLISSSLGTRLHKNELAHCRNALTLCSDALDEWGGAKTDEERFAAAIRFGTAAASLPAEVEIEPLLSLSRQMYSGYSALLPVNTYKDAFSLLAALEYDDEAEAREIIAKTLSELNDAITPSTPPMPPSQDTESAEVVAYTKKIVKKGIRAIFGSSSYGLEPVLNDSGDTFTAEAANLRMSFSAADGCLESFIYIRLGDTLASELNESERITAAREFLELCRYPGPITDVAKSGELCGFLVTDITAGGEIYRTAVDRYGRVWSITKVKR